MLFRTKVLDPWLPVIPANAYGPQLPLAAFVTHRGPEPADGGLADVGLEPGDGLVLLGSGEPGLGEPGSGDPAPGEPALGEAGVGEPGLGKLCGGDEEVDLALVLGEVVGRCGVALLMSGPQPVSTTMVKDTAIAGQIRFGFTSKLLYLLENQRRASTGCVWLI
jgi:hypothetical protein